MIKLEKKYHFYAAHRNKEAGEKCGRIHGHLYRVKCQFTFTELNNGITMLFSDVDAIVEPIIKQYDHYFLLNESDKLCFILSVADEPFIQLPFETSAENMAIHLFNQIKREGLPITRIELQETESSNIIYEPQ